MILRWKSAVAGVLYAAFSVGCANLPNPGSLDVGAMVAKMRASGQFKEAADQRDWVRANALYQQYPEPIESGQAAQVRVAVAAINGQWAPRLMEARRGLESQLASADTTPAALQASVKQAQALLLEYRTIPLLKPSEVRLSPETQRLESVWSDTALAAFLSPRFEHYDHARQPLFFNGLETLTASNLRKRLVNEQVASIAKALGTADAQKSAELLKAYTPMLEPAARKPLERAYLNRLAAASSGPLRFDQLLQMSEATRAAGLTLDPIRIVRLEEPIPVAMPKLNGKPVAPAVLLNTIESEATKAAQESQPYMLVVDASQGAQVSTLSAPKTISVQKQTGTSQSTNPAYAKAQEELVKAEAELREVEKENVELQSQARSLAAQSGSSGSALGAFGAVLGSVMGTNLTVSARQAVNDARKQLASTPTTLSKPVYGQEQRITAMEITRNLTELAIYLVDTRERTFRKASQRVLASEERSLQGLELESTVGRDSMKRPSSPIEVELDTAALTAQFNNSPTQPVAQLASAVQSDRAAFEREVAQMRTAANAVNEGIRTQVAQMRAPEASNGSNLASTAAVGKAGLDSGAVGGNSCPTTLASLDQRLPHFTVPELENVRAEAIRTQIVPPIQKWKANGKPLSSLVDQTLASARESDGQIKVATQCASAVDVSDERFQDVVNNGELSRLQSCDGIRNACLCGALIHKLNAMIMRAIAAAVQCHSQTMGP